MAFNGHKEKLERQVEQLELRNGELLQRIEAWEQGEQQDGQFDEQSVVTAVHVGHDQALSPAWGSGCLSEGKARQSPPTGLQCTHPANLQKD